MRKKAISLILAVSIFSMSITNVFAAEISGQDKAAGAEKNVSSEVSKEETEENGQKETENKDTEENKQPEENQGKEETKQPEENQGKEETKQPEENQNSGQSSENKETQEDSSKQEEPEKKEEAQQQGNGQDVPATPPAEEKKKGLNKSYLALGADLNAQQRTTVLQLFGLTEADLANYDVIYITNADEHKYLDSYLDKSVIGTRALSSVLVEKKEEGHGVLVTTKNISYCTTGMYRNALITAGVTDAEIIVAGPIALSGTAALVGAMKAYEMMTGEQLSTASMDAAINELVTTGELTEILGDSEKVEELIAYIKQLIVENGLDNIEDIKEAIRQAAKELGIKLTDAQIDDIAKLMQKIAGLDLDIDKIKSQAEQLYKKLAKLNESGFFNKIGQFFTNIFSSIFDFFSGLFA